MAPFPAPKIWAVEGCCAHRDTTNRRRFEQRTETSADGHENQIQFALERGISAMIAALSTKQLPYPSSSFEMVHFSRCRVDWHENDGILLKEADRLSKAKGYFVYSAPPAYRKDKEYPVIWSKLMNLTSVMCWKLIAQKVQTAIWVKLGDQSCILQNVEHELIQACDTEGDDPAPSWYTPLKSCVRLNGGRSDLQQLPTRAERLC
ncbi:hypothetical protein Droror1_Dr00027962 [Drosera rotundifolia]